ncbi:O-antigen ligase family protein [Tistrella bauzanensis]|uniref:O-antigen ligase family protein n=1 Tax=Tistrella arctica TaxID=3133430 RepID=A0ABU9YS29_9PROT
MILSYEDRVVQRVEFAPAFALFFGFSCAFFALPVVGAVQIFLSHLIYITMIAFAGAYCAVMNPRFFGFFVMWLVVICALNLYSALNVGLGDRYASDIMKILIYASSAAFVSHFLSLRTMTNIGFGLGIGLPMFIFVSVFALGTISFTGGRLWLENAGGPNTFGAMLTLSMLMIISHQGKHIVVKALLLSVLLITLLSTGSRANLLGLLIAFLYGPQILKRISIMGMVSLVLLLLVVVTIDIDRLLDTLSGIERVVSITEGSDPSSGRVDIWANLIRDLLSTPQALLFGKGPGSAEIMSLRIFPVFWVKNLASPHSTWVGSFYYFGIFGITFLICMLIYLAIHVFRRGNLLQQRLFIYYMMVTPFDNHFIGSQGIVYHALALAILFTNPSKVEPKRPVALDVMPRLSSSGDLAAAAGRGG